MLPLSEPTLRGGTATCVYFTDVVMAPQSGESAVPERQPTPRPPLPHSAHHTHKDKEDALKRVGAQIMTSWAYQGGRNDVIITLLTLIIMAGLSTPSPSTVSLCFTQC